MSEYPEHDKLDEVDRERIVLGEFLDWLDYKDYLICTDSNEEHFNEEGDHVSAYRPAYRSIESWLAEFLEIDLKKLEDEKRAMLESVRALNG